MKRRNWILGAGLALLAGGSAIALGPGTTVYVKVKNTHIFRKPDPNSELAVKAVQPGTALIWKGKVEGANMPWQQVTVHGRTGYVLGSNLSLTKPSDELEVSDDAQHIDSTASSGDAVKALGGGAQAYAQKHQNEAATAVQMQTLEVISDRVTDDLVTKHVEGLAKEHAR